MRVRRHPSALEARVGLRMGEVARVRREEASSSDRERHVGVVGSDGSMDGYARGWEWEASTALDRHRSVAAGKHPGEEA